MKVLFGTTVSINKNGRLASCSNLEWTKGKFQIKFNISGNEEWATIQGKNGKPKPIKRDLGAHELQLGKCYKKDDDEDTFSFLLENFFKNIYNPDGKS